MSDEEANTPKANTVYSQEQRPDAPALSTFEVPNRNCVELAYREEETDLEVRVEVLHPQHGFGVLEASASNALREVLTSLRRRTDGSYGGVALPEG